MSNTKFLKETPWDSKVFGIPTYELLSNTEEALELTKDYKGHITLKIDPLCEKELIQKYDFYYTDTLIEPFCRKKSFTPYFHDSITINFTTPISDLKKICLYNSFEHGRFHKDPFLPNALGDLRYASWLEQLHVKGKVMALMFDNEVAGFFCADQNKIPLHALDKRFRGRGLAKYFWSSAISYLFQQGYEEVSSSVSASNIPVINLYVSLGFSFRNPVEVYHKYNNNY